MLKRPPDEGTSCPVLVALRGTPEWDSAVEVLYRFRDEVLAQSQEGPGVAKVNFWPRRR
jgi:hypothetical protein